MPVVAPRSAASRSASGNTMLGDLPPSSSVIFLSVSAAARMMPLPVVVSPVNAILSIPGCATSAWPTLESGRGHHVEHAGRQPDLHGDLAERERRQRRLARRLQDDRVAGRERRRHLPRRQQQREVPRHDRRDDAERLAERVGEVVALHGDGLAHHLVGPAGVGTRSIPRPRGSRCGGTRRSACRCAASRAGRSRRPAPISRSASRLTSRPRSRADIRPHGPFSAARAACDGRVHVGRVRRGDGRRSPPRSRD